MVYVVDSLHPQLFIVPVQLLLLLLQLFLVDLLVSLEVHKGALPSGHLSMSHLQLHVLVFELEELLTHIIRVFGEPGDLVIFDFGLQFDILQSSVDFSLLLLQSLYF
mmetsp:Transcript_34/g.37  ORF Transcript_34/g.37 Transcript_34/m.37 type:complete len:107 (-) Transcript_34:769-1089(-)